MASYDDYKSISIFNLDPYDALDKIKLVVDEAIEHGWKKVYLLPDEDLLFIRGVKPADPMAVEAAKEKRRKQFERLKKEFESEERDRMTKLIDKMTLK